MTESFVCAIGGGKGGVGKSTVAINVGTALAKKGHEVVVVDADLALPTIGRMLSVETDVTLHEILAGQAQLDEALATTRDGLRVLPGNPSLAAYPGANADNLEPVIDALREQFKTILIDVSAAISDATFQSYLAADGAVLVTLPTEVSIDDSEKAAELVNKADITVYGIIINQLSRKRFVDRARDVFDVPVLAAIPEYTDGILPHPVVTTASRSPTAEAYDELGDTVATLSDQESVPSDHSPRIDESWFVEQTQEVSSQDQRTDQADSEARGTTDTEDEEEEPEDDDNDGLIL